MRSPSIILITGANQGLGFEAARILASSSDHPQHLILAGRSVERALRAVTEIQALKKNDSCTLEAVQLDVNNDSSISTLYDHVKKTHGRLDVLVNNAGISVDGSWQNGSISARQALHETLTTNTISAAVVTEHFLPLLEASTCARILFVSSELGCFAHATDPSDKFYCMRGEAYRMSKAALNMYTLELWKRLQKEGSKAIVFGICPGFNVTMLGGFSEGKKDWGATEPHIGGQVIADAVSGKRDDCAGGIIWEEGTREW